MSITNAVGLAGTTEVGWAGQGGEPQARIEATSLVGVSDGGTGPGGVRFC